MRIKYDGLIEAAEHFFYQPEKFVYNLLPSKIQNPETLTINKDLKKHMSKDGQLLYNSIIELPIDAADILATSSPSKLLLPVLREYLKKKKNWKDHRINKAIKEVKGCLHECDI